MLTLRPYQAFFRKITLSCYLNDFVLSIPKMLLMGFTLCYLIVNNLFSRAWSTSGIHFETPFWRLLCTSISTMKTWQLVVHTLSWLLLHLSCSPIVVWKVEDTGLLVLFWKSFRLPTACYSISCSWRACQNCQNCNMDSWFERYSHNC